MQAFHRYGESLTNEIGQYASRGYWHGRLRALTWGAACIFLALWVSACGGGDVALPVTSVTATIGPAGGTVTGPDGVQVIIPAGALSQPTTIGIARTTAGAPPIPEAYQGGGYVYELTPHGLTFNELVTVRAPVPAGTTTPLIFMASVGEGWKLLDSQMVNGMAEWQRNSFSYMRAAGLCLVPVSMMNDPNWCVSPVSYARVTATPSGALVQTSAGSMFNGDAGSYRIDQSTTLQFKTTFGVPKNCSNISATFKRRPYQGTAAGYWGAAVDIQTKYPTVAASGVRNVGVETFDFSFDHHFAGKNLFSIIIDFDCPGVTRSGGVVSGWDYGNLYSDSVGDGMVVTGNVPVPLFFFNVGGSVSGLTGSGLVLQNNGTNFTPVVANGSFSFSSTLGAGAPYNVTVRTQPAGQTCTVTNGSGTANANISNVAVNCIASYSIGGTVTGMAGTGLALQNNGADDLTVNASGVFVLATPVAAGGAYSVTVLTQPSGSTCTVSNGSGVANAAVNNVVVACTSIGALALVANTGSTNGTNGLSVYRINASTGALSLLSNVSAGNTPSAVVVSPNGLFAYVGNWVGGTISSYSLDSINGTVSLIPLSSPSSLNPTSIAMDRLGRYIWVTNWGYSTLSAFAIGTNGALAAAGAPKSTLSAYPYAMTAHPTMDFVYVAHGSSGAITVYSVDTASGALTLIQTVNSAVASPSGLVIDPSGHFAFAISQLGSISKFSINQTTGQLTSTGFVNTGGNSFAIAIHPNGQYLYVTNDAVSSNVVVFAFNSSTGALTAVGSPVSAGNGPRGVAVNAAGTYLYVTNYISNDVSAFSIGGGGSTLTSLGAAVPAGSTPQGIALAP